MLIMQLCRRKQSVCAFAKAEEKARKEAEAAEKAFQEAEQRRKEIEREEG